MNVKGSNHKTAAAWNRGLTIQLLRRHGTLSRHDISRITKLQGSTLSYIVRELIQKNVVRVVGKRQSTQVGQRQVLLTLNAEMGWILGVSVRPGLATLVLLNAAGGRVDSMQTAVEGPLESLPRQLHQALNQWLQQRGSPPGNLLAIGVGIPGVVDADAGVVLRSIPLDAVNVPLREQLSAQFGVTAVIDHDACYGACSEAADGAAADASHFIYLAVNTAPHPDGVRISSYGSSIFLQGKIYRGAFYAAGELGGPIRPVPINLTAADMTALTDPEGAMPAALIELADHIGSAIGPVVNFIDVQMVVLSGTARITNRRFISAVQLAITEKLVSIPGRSVRVVRSTWGLEAVARGAAISAFDAILAEGQLFGDTDERKILRAAKEPIPV